MKGIRVILLITLALPGCAAVQRASTVQTQSAQPISPPSAPDPFAAWTDPNDLKGKTLDGIRAMNIQCVYMLKPEARIECLTLLFESHQRVTGKPYLMTITENWLSTGHPVGILDRVSGDPQVDWISKK